MKLHRFPPRSTPRCCGTCDRWREESGAWRHGPWCNELSQFLPGDLTACGCDAWRAELYETYAVALYQQLSEETREDHDHGRETKTTQ